MGVTGAATAAAVLTGLAGAAVAVASSRSATRSSVGVLLRTALVMSVFGLVGAFVTLPELPFGLFAFAHLLYLLVVVALPIAGLGLLVAWRGDAARRGLAIVAVVLLLPAPIGIWSTHVAPFRLREDRATVVLRPGRTLDRPLRIGVLSDLQNTGVTGYERRAVDRLLAQDPDVILIAGDLFQGDRDQLAATLPTYRKLLGRLRAPGGTFVVPGDTDGDVEAFHRLLEGTGITILEDEVTTTEVRGQRLVIGGVRLDYDAAASQPVYGELQATSGGDPVILLGHRPDAVRELEPGSRVDLTVAGHTHGGQIALPLLGPPVTLSDLPRSVGAGGLHEVDGNAVYVSTGIGIERGHAPQIRFLTRPSYGIVTITPPRG